MLRKPILALAADRTRKAQINHVCGDPEAWFDSQPFWERNLYAASFDFFVDWESEQVCDEVWIKRISDSDSIQEKSETELLRLISACDGEEKSNRIYLFLAAQGMKEKYMLFRDDVPEAQWESGQEKVVELDLSRYKENSVARYDAKEIQEKIRQLRKRPVPIGRAGLIYATSSLEGYLSRQPYFWPGDADTVIFDGKNEAAAILEFKKHTARSKIPFADQKITNYLQKDYLKYKSLALLRDRLHTDLFVLYYPIQKEIPYMIIEKLDGPADALFASERYEIPLPNYRKADQMRAFADQFITDVLKRQEKIR